jgi:ribosome-associated toxin RatA of RatAB toxin-antitoxin module
MHTDTQITIQGDIDRIFTLASAVEDWPRWLPHYRWVHVVSGDRTDRIVAMAAHRDGFPVRWTARQRLEPAQHRIHFTHVRGISRGMEVTWFLEADGPLVHVRIVHDLTWRWWPIGPWVAQHIIGELFVSNIASKTLRTLKQQIESHDALPSR